jgi:hypothetical protein
MIPGGGGGASQGGVEVFHGRKINCNSPKIPDPELIQKASKHFLEPISCSLNWKNLKKPYSDENPTLRR